MRSPSYLLTARFTHTPQIRPIYLLPICKIGGPSDPQLPPDYLGQVSAVDPRHDALAPTATFNVPVLESGHYLALQGPDLSDGLQLPSSDDPVADPMLLLRGGSDWFDAMTPLLPLEYQYDSDTSRRLLNVYYLRFHAAHPILLPLRRWTKQSMAQYPRYLTAVMQYIGSQCESMMQNKSQQDYLGRMLADQNVRNGYLVQAKLLFAVTLHAHNERQTAREVLDSAIQLALDLGMSRTQFAADNGDGSQSLEESWRRTWWELYVVDGMFAALDQQTSFRLHSVDCNLALPCEELDYSMTNVGLEKAPGCVYTRGANYSLI